ncbi:MAG: NADH:ubiquinone oxidoreductase [Candidatus Fluviicola riflensis]|nr:MAG: GxxExxY protein [Candidatus Fluviicola riflensis]OGS80102.1 MAG: NADH:ubiquinone oxidoreductase [Candidatus Fluviicola riflensis]OGS87274.1 MAG: NADH:ubiquinone oxidoreductase [Fluviicola sp. RIFCSPHIGHO2_01_FULL_43_53]OGS90031.1 MAG: NADH:ubiquinone oxidoreductase [Fluviicola sp. RIFCSPHIGHO2_12_FULL_43_24]
MKTLIYKEEAYEIIGLCMEVHKELGPGFSEIVYKDALEHELKLRGINFEREREFQVYYKGIILPHKFYADFLVDETIILEVKTVSSLQKEHLEQTINYLCVSGLNLGLLVNFRSNSLEYKRLVR